MEVIIPGKDYFIEVLVAQLTDPEGTPSPAAGRNDVIVWFSDTAGGVTIAAPLSLTCADAAATKVVAGITYQKYVAELQGSDTATPLGDRIGQVIYRNEKVGTHDASSVQMRVKRRA